MKCAASFTKELVSPASGEITFVNMRASSYVGELIVLRVARVGCQISLKIKSTLQKICQRAPALELETLLSCLTEGRFITEAP